MNTNINPSVCSHLLFDSNFHLRFQAFFHLQTTTYSQAAAPTQVISLWTANKQQMLISSRHVVDKTAEQWVSIH